MTYSADGRAGLTPDFREINCKWVPERERSLTRPSKSPPLGPSTPLQIINPLPISDTFWIFDQTSSPRSRSSSDPLPRSPT